MNKTKKLVSLCIVLSIGLFSCDKKSDDPISLTGSYLVKKISGTTNGTSWHTSFEYDNHHRLTKASIVEDISENAVNMLEVRYLSDSQCSVKLYTKNSDGSTSDSTVYEANEVGDRINIAEKDYADGKVNHTEKYYYTTNYSSRKITGLINDSEESPYSYLNLTYGYDAADNIQSKLSRDKSGNMIEMEIYTYDDKKGIFSNIKTPAWILLGVLDLDHVDNPLFLTNNITELKTDEVLDVKYTYKYDRNNYPLSIDIEEYDEGDTEKIFVTAIEYY